MDNKIDKDLIRNVLNDLLSLKDGDPLPNKSGVCKEILVAVRIRENREVLSCDCPEYKWANNISNDLYVDSIGKMTQIRREFIWKLLILLKKDEDGFSSKDKLVQLAKEIEGYVRGYQRTWTANCMVPKNHLKSWLDTLSSIIEED